MGKSFIFSFLMIYLYLNAQISCWRKNLIQRGLKKGVKMKNIHIISPIDVKVCIFFSIIDLKSGVERENKG